MADYLQDLSYGLRQAATILSPEIQQQVFRADEREKNLADSTVLQHVLQQATPQAQMAKLQLENEIGWRRSVAQANGDPAKIAAAAMQFKPEIAQRMFDAQERRLTALQTARMENDRKLTELELRLADQAINREHRDAVAKMAEETRRRGQDLQRAAAEAADATRRLQIEMMGDKQAQAEARLKDTAVRNLGTAFERAGISQTDSVLRAAEDSVKDDTVLEYVNGPKSALPDVFLSNKITDARQAINRLFNITLKDRSGAAVTLPELERLKSEFGRGVFKKPEQLRSAVAEARKIINDHYRGISAGYGPEALSGYNENLRAVGGIPILQETASEVPPPPGFKVDK